MPRLRGRDAGNSRFLPISQPQAMGDQATIETMDTGAVTEAMIAAGVLICGAFAQREEDSTDGDGQDLVRVSYNAMRGSDAEVSADAKRADARPSARSRGYNTRWEKARRTFLGRRPLCATCEREGRITVATVVDHIKPHKGDTNLFWDTSNWQPLCKPHHDSTKQREERGSTQVIGADGWPT